ncbi:uncharacterized protein [Aegilops tauschii subsp. strangulata]|uniref:uncharacterized protein n=1 Tax=Aegilops tauschii subsp. strangulata TaxID=200361 RepID=UPI003CC8D097
MNEVVIWKILVRLPPKAILRCRTVRRAWRLATSTCDFLLAHHARQPTTPLVYGYNCASDVVESLDIIPLDNVAGSTSSSTARDLAFAAFMATASCDGLLLLSLYSTHFSIYNPSTRQYAPLQQLRGFLPLGMYRHDPTGEYRLLLRSFTRSTCDGPLPDAQHGAYVFSLGSGQQPRCIGCSDAEDLIYLSSGSVLLHVIGCGDMFEMGSMLGMFGLNYEGTSVEIWVMQDYEAEIWAFKYRVELPVTDISLQCGKFDHRWEVIVTSSWDGDVLVLVHFDGWLLQVGMEGHIWGQFVSAADSAGVDLAELDAL